MLLIAAQLCNYSHMNQEFDWNDLKAFLAVMRTGRLTAAAKLMKIDHSTLGRRIVRLEEALQTRLFDRLTVGYRPTAAGEQLLRETENIESLTIGLQSRLTNMTSELAGAVRVAAPEGFSTFFLASRIGQLTSTHPKIEFELIAGPSVVSLSKREADMAVTNICPQKGRLHALKLTDYELGIYASPSYLSNSPKIQNKRDLLNHNFIGYMEDMLPTAEHAYLNEINKAIVPNVRISNVFTQLAATQGGVGLCVLPYFMCASQPNLVRILPSDIRIFRSYWLVIHSDLRELPRVRATADFIIDSVRNDSQLFG
jgi:DNA-binding transcriptional LysR family regulator